jgi:hypothetical protein
MSAEAIASLSRWLASSGFPSGVAARTRAICEYSHILYS